MRKSLTSLHPCAHCGFWISPKQVYCPNCNHSQPFSLAFVPFKVLLFSTGTLGILTLFHQLELGVTWAHLGVGLAEGLGVTGGLLGSIWLGSLRWFGWSILPPKPNSCLQQDEARIHDRLRYLQERHPPIDQVRQRACHIRDLQRRSAILQALDHAVELLQQQVDQYQIKLWEIALLRWHNQIQPLLQSQELHFRGLQPSQNPVFHRLRSSFFRGSAPTPSDVATTLETLEKILTTGQTLLVDGEHRALSDQSGGVELLQRLEKALNSSDRLYQDLVALQTSIVLKGLSHFELDTHLNSQGHSEDVAEMLAAFSDLPSVSDFFQGFDALENEYLRLQGELEVRQLSSTTQVSATTQDSDSDRLTDENIGRG